MQQFQVKINGQPATVYAVIHGRYYPATQFEPETHPDVEIRSIVYKEWAIPESVWPLFDLESVEEHILCANGTE